jgi:uncharacterized membrane protein
VIYSPRHRAVEPPTSALLSSGTVPTGTLPTSRQPSHWITAAAVILVAVANLLALTTFRLPFLGPAIEFWFLVLLPVYFLYKTRLWGAARGAERLGYSIAGALLLLMVLGLAVNTLLPFLGVQHPLAPTPIVALGDVLNVSLYLFRRRFGEIPAAANEGWQSRIRTISQKESRVLVCSALSIALAVAGANRLNNGAGDTVGLAALACTVVSLAYLLRWQSRVREAVISGSLYMSSLALLLMTSLRGWYVTGPDIQTEYLTFQLTESHARWSMDYFHSAYYACLSITILPTEIAQVVHVEPAYVYKVFFQLLFAMCPVLVYVIARRFCSVPVSIIAVVFFIGSPEFFTDMPFVARQEVAFLFASVAVLAITNREWDLRRRQIAFLVAAVGVEVSHYSSMYTFIGTFAIAWVAQFFTVRDFRRAKEENVAYKNAAAEKKHWATSIRTIGLGSVGLLIGITFVWGQLATQTANGALSDAKSAIGGLVGPNAIKSLHLANLPVVGSTPSPKNVIEAYHRFALLENLKYPGRYIPAVTVYKYTTPVTNALPPMPLTDAGSLLKKVGISASEVNTDIRGAAAKDELLFPAIGFVVILFNRRLRRRVGREVFFIAIGSSAMVALIIILPNLSVDYGFTRAFQQALIVVAPVLVVGSLAIFWAFGPVVALRCSAVVAIGIFISTTGLLPQILGGYPAQLNLNNSGQYYDIYYEHPQEVAAVDWLGDEPRVVSDGVQASFTPNRFAFTAPTKVTGSQLEQGPGQIGDIFPLIVRRSSWVVLSYWTVHTSLTEAYFNGQLITYVYPLDLLRTNKNLVYNNGGSEIFK